MLAKTAANVTLQNETFATLRNDWLPLIQEHWREVAKAKHLMRLNVNIARYKEVEADGRLHIATARQERDTLGRYGPSGRLVGYSVHFIVRPLHYQHLLWAEDDIHYLIPELRGTGLHAELRAFAHAELKKRGVQAVTARTKIGHMHEKALLDMGFHPFDMVYFKELTDDGADGREGDSGEILNAGTQKARP